MHNPSASHYAMNYSDSNLSGSDIFGHNLNPGSFQSHGIVNPTHFPAQGLKRTSCQAGLVKDGNLVLSSDEDDTDLSTVVRNTQNNYLMRTMLPTMNVNSTCSSVNEHSRNMHASDLIHSSHSSMPTIGKKTKGRVKIKMEFIDNKLRRYTTFSKRKTGIMKKAYELSTLTGTQVMLLVASETGHVYTFATRKLQPMITSEAGKALIQTCLNSPDPIPDSRGDQRMTPTGFEETELTYNVHEDDQKVREIMQYSGHPPHQSASGSGSDEGSIPSPIISSTQNVSKVSINSEQNLRNLYVPPKSQQLHRENSLPLPLTVLLPDKSL